MSRPTTNLLVRAALVLVVLTAVGGWRYRITRPAYRFDRGLEAAQAENWSEAEWHADRLEAAGDPPAAALLRAEVLFRQRSPGPALTALRPFANAPDHPRRLEAVALSARCYSLLNRPREAMSSWKHVLEHRPNDPEAHRNLAIHAYDLGQLLTAIDHLTTLQKLDTRDGKPARMAGTIQQDLGNHELAVAAYREALTRELPPETRSEVYLELTESLLKLRKFEDVLALKPERTSPDVSQTIRWRIGQAEAFHALGQTEPAKQLVDAVLKSNADDVPALQLRGAIHLAEGQATEAVGVLERAHQKSPKTYLVAYLLAQAYTTVGRSADAARLTKVTEQLRAELDRVTELTREAERKPWDAAVRIQLAELSEQMGHPELATMWRKAAAAVQPRP